MSQPESESRLAWLVATLGGLPQTKEIIDLSKEVGASQIALTANEPPSPQQPATLDEEAWELYKEKSLARIERQRRKRVEEAKLQCREEQVKSLSQIWSQFLKVSTQHKSPDDTRLQMHRAEWQREEHVFEDGQQEGEEHAEAVEEERGDSSSASYVPTTQISSLPKTHHPPGGKGLGFTTFVDIWNHGNPRDKIIESEPGAGEYYVIRCRRGECSLLGRHFGPDPYRGARAHLRHAHGRELGADYRFSNGNILRTLGIHVKGCNTARAKESNAIFVAWYNNPASTTKGADESITTQPYSQSLRGRRRRSVHVGQPSAAMHKGRRKRLPPEDEAEQPYASVSKRAKRGKKAEKVEAGTAIPEPSSATAHDALPELADQAPAGISLKPLDAIQQETNATQDEEWHGQPDANREAQARVRGEDASAMSVSTNGQLSHEEPSATQRDATPEPSNVTIRSAPPELADQAPAEVPTKSSDAVQQGTDAIQEQELPRRSDTTPESESRRETAYQETLRAYRATVHTESCPRSLPKPQHVISSSPRDQLSENLASLNTAKAAQRSTFGGSADCEVQSVPIYPAQPQPSRAPMEPLFWYKSLHLDAESSPQRVDCGIPSGETGAIQRDQLNGINAASADLRFVASQCLNLESRNPTQSGYYSHVQESTPHESSTQTSAEHQTYPGTSKSQQPSLHAPVADIGEVVRGQRGGKSGEAATLTNISPTPAAVNRRNSAPSFAESSAFRLPGLAGLASQAPVPRNILRGNTTTGGGSHWSGPTLP